MVNKVTDPRAVEQALDEFDRIGRNAFLEKYHFGSALSYFIKRNGKTYDSKAIYGAAHGYQYPELGPLSTNDFTGGDVNVRKPLEALGYEFELASNNEGMHISQHDLELIKESRKTENYYEISDEQRAAYRRVHAAVEKLAQIAVSTLENGGGEYASLSSSGFTVRSGVRGRHPKDLWFGVYNTKNAGDFVENPQLYIIVRAYFVEIGFTLTTHVTAFSDSSRKKKLREVSPKINSLVPNRESQLILLLKEKLNNQGGWRFFSRSRTNEKQYEFSDLDKWISYVHSERGKQETGACINRFFHPREIDDVNLGEEIKQCAETFRPLMELITPEQTEPNPESENIQLVELLREFVAEFGAAHSGPFKETEGLWSVMRRLKQEIEAIPEIQNRPDLSVKVSVGQGNWAHVPWIAILNENVTQSTQSGIYIVLLFTQDLSRVYLTLNQGMTSLVDEHGQAEAREMMEEIATSSRAKLGHLIKTGFQLDNDVDLKTTSWRPKLYEYGTIAHCSFSLNELPDDQQLKGLFADLVDAYDRVLENSKVDTTEEKSPTLPAESIATPYFIDDALDDLFIDRAQLERMLSIWRRKKNLILQGAPGVGKSYLARRLAYSLMGSKDDSRVEIIQFHQSYAYEDFVQGYRPDGRGGFELKNGVFVEFQKRALQSPDQVFIFIIDEINRGNLSKILGELMLLIESDKRGPKWSARLAYANRQDAKFFVPENVFILGMMNTADRSLSVVDYALRRRFAFETLSPQFSSEKFRNNLADAGVPDEAIEEIIFKFNALNDEIASDRLNLGPGFQIGHSFFVPPENFEYSRSWYKQIIETEILTLLDEYWFDAPEKVDHWRSRLASSAR